MTQSPRRSKKRSAVSPKAAGLAPFDADMDRPSSKQSSHLSDYNPAATGAARPTGAGPDAKGKQAAGMMEAKQIAFFSNATGETSPVSKMGRSDFRQRDLDAAYTLDDAHSFEGAATDEEEEERAVAEFVSDIELHDGSVKLRQPNS